MNPRCKVERRRAGPHLWPAVLGLALLGACSSEEFSTSDLGGAGVQDRSAATADRAGLSSDLYVPVPHKDIGCGGQSIPITLQKKGDIPDLHLVVDRSGSMIMPINLFDLSKGTKWAVMKKTLDALVVQYTGNIRFGLTLFPSDYSCGAGKIDVPLALGNTAAIQSALQKTSPNGNTPTHTTLAVVNAYLKTVPLTKGARYVLLATDGMPNCGATEDADTSAETLTEVKNLAAAGVKTFVVGFGDIIAGNPTLLNQLAVAGGAVNPTGPQKFYPAANEQQLKQALFAIAGGIIPPPCTYKLSSKPPDPDKVTVTFDGTAVPRSLSSTDGWNYSSGGTEITFYGSYCTKLRQGQVKQVVFLFGCKGPVVK